MELESSPLSPSPTNKQNNWIARAIRDKLTILNDEELEDFCQKVKHATFAFFKVKTDDEGSTHFYLMTITNNNNIIQ
jgi:hypothetical protein